MARARLHLCFAPECNKDIPLDKLLCFHHWKATPQPLRDDLMSAWKYGLQWRCHPTQNYLDARDAIARHLREAAAKRATKVKRGTPPLALRPA